MSVTIGSPGWLAQLIPADDVAARAMAVLRMQPGDADQERITQAAASALEKIEGYLDRDADPIVDPAPETIIQAATQVTIEAYRRKDAPFGVLNTWAEADYGPIRIGPDWVKGVETDLWSYRGSFGVG